MYVCVYVGVLHISLCLSPGVCLYVRVFVICVRMTGIRVCARTCMCYVFINLFNNYCDKYVILGRFMVGVGQFGSVHGRFGSVQ